MRKFLLFFIVIMLSILPCAQAAEIIALEKDADLPFEEGESVMRISFLSIGAEDGILIECGGETMLIDCGIESSGKEAAALLQERGITHIDYAVNTHPHDDHIDGFIPLFEEISVGQFLVCFPLDFDEHMTAAVAAAEAHEIPVVLFTEDTDLSFGGNTITLYQNTTSQHINYRSMAMHVRFGECAAMLTADIGRSIQEEIALEAGDAVRAEIFKLAHHGLSEPNRTLFETVSPQICVLTNSVTSAQVTECMEFLTLRNCPVLSVYRGSIDFTTNGECWVYQQ